MISNIRQLGYWEFGCYLYQRDYYGSANIIKTAAINGVVDEKHMRSALLMLYQRHPFLRSTIVDNGTDITFYEDFSSNKIDAIFLDREDDEHWSRITMLESSKPFSSDQQLWRIYFLIDNNKTDMLLNLHHSIGDGLSINIFYRDLLTYYHACTLHETVHINSLPFIEPIEILCAKNISWEQHCQRVENPQKIEIGIWPCSQSCAIESRVTKAIYHKLDIAKIDGLLKLCHSRQLRLNSILTAILLKSHLMINPEINALSVSIAVNLRGYTQLDQSQEHLGCLVSMVKNYLGNSICKMDLWTLAKHYQDLMDNNIKQFAFYPVNYDKQFIENDRIPIDSTQQTAFLQHFGVTNNGRATIPKIYGQLTLDTIYGGTSRQSGDFSVYVNFLTFHDHSLLYFAYTYPLQSDEYVALLLNYYQKNIDRSLAD